jgi:FkbM family methyltransferase
MIKVNLKRESSNLWPAKKLYNISKHLTRMTRFGLTVRDGDVEYHFTPAGKGDLQRYLTFFSKEEGTIKWIKDTVKDNDVFFDIGANVGLYSLYAARQAKDVKVFAFEPHKYNFVCLVDNISKNNLLSNISPIAIPLGERSDVFKLNYMSVESGASMTQLGHKKLPDHRDFTPKFEEIVCAVPLDELVEKKMVPMPNAVKIDVDGNELSILKGMTRILSSFNKPRSVQVEINPGEKGKVIEFFEKLGYRHAYSHYTASKKPRFEKGASEDELAHNAVFEAI